MSTRNFCREGFIKFIGPLPEILGRRRIVCFPCRGRINC